MFATDASREAFWVKVKDRVWGPYSRAQMAGFVEEGRVVSRSLVSRAAEGPFIEAISQPPMHSIFNVKLPDSRRAILLAEVRQEPEPVRVRAPLAPVPSEDLTGTATLYIEPAPVEASAPTLAIEPVATPVSEDTVIGQPEPSTLKAANDPATSVAGAMDEANIFIWADLMSDRALTFEAALVHIGPFAPIGPGAWIVRSRMTAGQIRNRLTPHLGRGDRCTVIDASRDRMAWFNLGPEVEINLREIWRSQRAA
jgi:hypothetical protein